MLKDSMKSAQKTHLFEDAERYKRLIRRMLYLTNTRPEITYVVNQLSQHMQIPKLGHYQAALGIIHYLKKDPGQGLLYKPNSTQRLKAYSDADFPSNQKINYWVLYFLCDSLVSWECKK
jgi:hypothetical protein